MGADKPGQHIPVTYDLQGAYDSSRAMERAFAAFSDALGEYGEVCVHPEAKRELIEAGPDTMEICKECELIIRQVQGGGN